MFEQYEEIMSHYNIQVQTFHKGRGAIIVDTNSGVKLLKEVRLHDEKINFLYELLTKLSGKGFHVDVLIQTKDGDLYVKDDNKKYILKEWVEGREISFNDSNDILLATKNMANLHRSTYAPVKKQYKKYDKSSGLLNTFERHNAELIRIRNNIRRMRNWSEFDILFLKSYKEFYEQCTSATDMIAEEYHKILKLYKDNKVIIHGQYNHHNLIKDYSNHLHIVNFEYANYHLPVIDLYSMLRKILEKNDWNFNLAKEIIKTYREHYSLSKEELRLLYYLFVYPEKYWKISNYYINLNKAWKPKQTLIKLRKVLKQEEMRQNFISNLKNYINV